MSRIFIERPILAWVIAIIIVLMGVGAIAKLPIAQYPDVAPTQITIRATYPGASADTLENSVTQILERELTGLKGLLYFNSSSTARGVVTVTATFDKGVDPDIAQVQVQNKIQAAVSRLPQQVQQQGVRVTKGSPDFLMIVAVYDETRKSTTSTSRTGWRPTFRTNCREPPASATSTCSGPNMRCGSGWTRTSSPASS